MYVGSPAQRVLLYMLGSNMLRMESVRELHYNRCMEASPKKKDTQALYLSAGFGELGD